ncbi:unnamed protein product [Brassicogethes aeneus]|uniref:Peptidase S1 domain-containing protein n=1 Tax=Brassicogethes aeneus TaxID=1431903 RepID=A0A9P0FCB6_BRAAE|nr:unnamed protein product [Brassicogethes aeneus]
MHLCGGTLIGKKWVITAAHCTYGNRLIKFAVRAGSSIYFTGGQVVPVKKITEHPKFNRTTLDYDVSVLELSEDITIENALPIEMADADAEVKTGSIGTITGWGSVSMEDKYKPSHDLQMVQIPVADSRVCKEAYGNTSKHVSERMICAGYAEGGKDACFGDSGGPLIVDGKLTGIVSFGYEYCAAPNYPGVYSSVPVLKEFIDSVVKQV